MDAVPKDNPTAAAPPAWLHKWDVPILVALAVVALALTHRGAVGEGFVFQLGPNDHGYLTGFAPHYEVADGVAARWTTYDATIDLPLSLEGGPAEVSYRFSRIFAETAQVEVTLDGATVDRFQARGGAVETRTARLPVIAEAPLTLGLVTDSHERQNRGLRLDWIRLEAGDGARLRPRGASLWLPPILAAFFFGLFRWSGIPRGSAALAACVWPLTIALWLPRDPFGFCHVVRQIGVTTIVIAALAALVLRRWPSGRWVVPIFVLGFLLKAATLFYPTTFYPDVANARDYVEAFRETSGSLAERGVETQIRAEVGYPRNVGGKDYAFPYSPLYFLPYGAFASPGAVEDAVRFGGLIAGSLSVLPLFWLGLTLFGARAGIIATWLWAFMPPIFSRLFLALHATVVGNFLDLLVMASVLALVLDPDDRRRTALVAGTTLVCLLVYTSSLFSVSAFFVFIAILNRRLAPRLLAILVTAGTITVVWLYWPFLIDFFTEILPALVGGGATTTASADAGSSAPGALARIPLFYGYLYPVVAGCGFVVARRRLDAPAFRWLAAYGLAFLLMLALRAFGAGIFKDLKEITFVAPLIALLSGAFIQAVSTRPRWGRAAAVLLAASLAWFGVSRVRGYLETYASPITSVANLKSTDVEAE